jgi:hypothetical protein
MYDAAVTWGGWGICRSLPGEEKGVRMADLPAAFVENVNWVKQPPPTQAHETHALHFWLAGPGPDFLAWRGFMFYHPGIQPTSQIIQRQNGIEGFGYLVPTAHSCRKIEREPLFSTYWVRVRVTFRTAEEHNGNATVNAVLRFHGRAGVLPENEIGVIAAEDFNEVIATEPGDVIMDRPNGWFLTLQKTLVSL